MAYAPGGTTAVSSQNNGTGQRPSLQDGKSLGAREQPTQAIPLREPDRSQRQTRAEPRARFGNRGERHDFAIEIGGPAPEAEERRTGIGIETDLKQLRRRKAGCVRAEIKLIHAVAGKNGAAPIIDAEGAVPVGRL